MWEEGKKWKCLRRHNKLITWYQLILQCPTSTLCKTNKKKPVHTTLYKAPDNVNNSRQIKKKPYNFSKCLGTQVFGPSKSFGQFLYLLDWNYVPLFVNKKIYP